MKSRISLLQASAAVLFAALAVLASMIRNSGGASQGQGADHQELSRGQRVYEANCAICHGENGNGRGMAAHMLVVQPRDFRPGLFKFRSTPSGALPTDDDLLKVVTNGIRWTAMVGRADLAESERRAVVQYVKTFSPRFANENSPTAIVVAPEPARTQELVAQGRQLYRDSECAKCHGESADGKGITSTELIDDWGWPLPASDITWRPLKRGADRREVYLTIATGLSGAAMPAYNAALSGKEIWALVYYLESLVPDARKRSARELLGEEQRGRMILRMHGTMGHGMMR